ncbi:MAG: DUF4268 domain-containing protein [Planctomycetaceae bacterium]
MPLYELTPTTFRPVPEASFAAMGIGERSDIQRLLRTQIDVLDDDLYVLTEEFGEWEDSKRRIDLLAIDSEANLVVIELKRTHDGGHMELQAIRYASMVSAMTFERAVQIHADFLRRLGLSGDEAESRILGFLDWSEPDEERFASDVRIVLVSEGFSKEVTTAVLWLRDREIDIRCIRLRPYTAGGKTLVDVEQLIPLPEAEAYIVRIREKEQKERRSKAERWSADAQQFCFDYWEGVLRTLLAMGLGDTQQSPPRRENIRFKIGWPACPLNAWFSRREPRLSVWLDCKGENGLSNFLVLREHRRDIEGAFGEPLDWTAHEDLNQGAVSWRSSACDVNDRDHWPEQHQMVADHVARLYRAVEPFVEKLNQRDGSG